MNRPNPPTHTYYLAFRRSSDPQQSRRRAQVKATSLRGAMRQLPKDATHIKLTRVSQ